MTRRGHEVQIGRQSSTHDRFMHKTSDDIGDERQQTANSDNGWSGAAWEGARRDEVSRLEGCRVPTDGGVGGVAPVGVVRGRVSRDGVAWLTCRGCEGAGWGRVAPAR